MSSGLVVAGTGHRPEDCPHTEAQVRNLANNKLRLTPNVTTFICGMAAGFDLWAGTEALDLSLDVIAAKPWKGHSPRKGDEELYERVLAEAIIVYNVTDVEDYPGAWVYPKRNHWMVDNADVVMAYYNGAQKGGTFECFTYAKKKEKKIANIINDPPF